ncbi:LacI family DNA-binding transcriptional regulator [Ferroacidibacillus organovorans]|uniref:HTH lacI-type domain-containing protein n=1 Tax=Ferroacidibacillus organovorans TaxID=1765683 RepID=A0A101XR20_9BACL|nr:LacI family DNA-binding transcriptional regulator [Ferroacidibacillus organovorans]KUO95964.1 hypothetical protein ATW55_02470 [Ferroacidibacillus organovorans]
MATIKDVATAAGVSVSTVSIALKHDPRVKEATKKKIFEAVDRLGYRPNGIARDLKMKSTQTMAVLLHDLGGPFYSELVSGVQDVALAYDYSPIISCSVGGKGIALKRLLLENRVDGAIILDPYIEESFIRKVASPNLPIVLLDREINLPYVYRVTSDHEGGAYAAVAHLIERGHQRIAFVGGPQRSLDNLLRYKGYQKALVDHGRSVDARFVYAGDFTEKSGYALGLSLSGSQYLPDAIFAANDEMAIGLLRAFSEKGLKIPQDIALVGFDDIRLSQYTVPKLTSIHQPMYELGIVATQILFRVLNGESNIEPVVLSTQLMIRDST